MDCLQDLRVLYFPGANRLPLPCCGQSKTDSTNILYITSSIPYFTDSSKRFSPLYLIPLQQRLLYLVLYTSKIRIRDVFCSEFFYVRIYHTLKYHVHVLFSLNLLFKI